jgi:1,4-dihydroxy-2-naphthoate octaprenyltransferase
VLAYVGVLWMSFFGPLEVWSLSVLISLPLAVRLLKQMIRKVPVDADARTAQLNTAFGVLLVISMIPAGLF